MVRVCLIFKLTLSYRGTDFCGWQKQKTTGLPSIQESVEEALSRILNQKTPVVASGRTDAGVHALRQVVVFRTGAKRSPKDILKGLNGLLPESIRVISVQRVSKKFHPQFAVKRKTYRYLVQNSGTANPLMSPYVYFFPEKLNLKRMQKAASFLSGRHDFSAFQGSSRKAKDTVRTMYGIEVKRIRDSLFSTEGLLGFTLAGDGFLHKMVRNIVGTLLEVGRKKLRPEDVKKILESGDRRLAGPTAPARGLTLIEVIY